VHSKPYILSAQAHHENQTNDLSVANTMLYQVIKNSFYQIWYFCVFFLQ